VRNVILRRAPYLAIVTMVLLQSCGMWDSFTAYFNTYYNAQRVFQEAEDEIWTMPDTKESGRNLLLPLNVSQGVKTKLTSVIEKCSKLLQYHPDAGLVDDALLMIGRSYYYQNEYQQAERKFHELMDRYPESSLILDAQVLLSFAYYKSGDFPNATKTAQLVQQKATEEGENALVAEAALVLAQIAVDQKEYARARPFFIQVGEYGNTSDKRTQAWMKVGEMLVKEREYAAAEEAYKRARSISTSFIGEYRAELGIARMLDKQKRFDETQEVLASLRSNANNRDFYGEIDLELGNVARDRGNLDEAIQQYKYVDTAYARTVPAADADLALGILYETSLKNYDSARVAYERGRSAITTAESRPEILRRADYVSKYILYRNDMVKLDSMLWAALHPRDSVGVAGDARGVDSSRGSRADSLVKSPSDTTKLAQADTTRKLAPQPPPLPLDSIHVRRASRMDDLAGLFYATMELPDSARLWYHRLVNAYPESRAVPRALYVLAQIEGADTLGGKVVADSIAREIIRRFPNSPFAEESRRRLGLPVTGQSSDPLERCYQSATLLMQNGKAAAAIDSFESIVQRAPSSPLAPRALYATAWTYEYQSDRLDSAAAAYERLVTLYPQSLYAQRVQPRVTEIRNARQAALAPKTTDSTAVGQGGQQPDKQTAPQVSPQTPPQGDKKPAVPPEKTPAPPGEKPLPPPAEEQLGKH
jgi:TolA-binding protein